MLPFQTLPQVPGIAAVLGMPARSALLDERV